MVEGETKATVAAREKVRLTREERETIKVAIKHNGVIPPDSNKEVLMGY
jgi:hypothetical protein